MRGVWPPSRECEWKCECAVCACVSANCEVQVRMRVQLRVFVNARVQVQLRVLCELRGVHGSARCVVWLRAVFFSFSFPFLFRLS